MLRAAPPKVLIVDLNNFSRYPTVSVGIMAAVLRQAGHEVDVFSPLAYGVPGVPREPAARPWGLLDQRLRYRTAMSTSKALKQLHAAAASWRTPARGRTSRRILEALDRHLADRPDVVLVSTYLMYFDVCSEITHRCKQLGIPVVIGGSYLNDPDVSDAWLEVGPLQGLVGGEVELDLPEIVRDVAAGISLAGRPGVCVPGSRWSIPAPPLKDLDAVPFPDYSDFPWDSYPNRIVPMITGRGCGWGVCTFCSDVTSAMGRTFRSRTPANVLDEIEHQSRACHSNQFVFTDLKLNSSLPMWRAVLDGTQHRSPGSQWIASVHVGSQGDNGLSPEELRAARRAGMVRLTTGLESGSQRVLDRMAKGADPQISSRFLGDAARAGISVRTTMIIGYPGETESDLQETARFLDRHADFIERVALNRFSIIMGTQIHRRLLENPSRHRDLTDYESDARMGFVAHRFRTAESARYRRAVDEVLSAAHRINRRKLRADASSFEGVM